VKFYSEEAMPYKRRYKNSKNLLLHHVSRKYTSEQKKA